MKFYELTPYPKHTLPHCGLLLSDRLKSNRYVIALCLKHSACEIPENGKEIRLAHALFVDGGVWINS